MNDFLKNFQQTCKVCYIKLGVFLVVQSFLIAAQKVI